MGCEPVTCLLHAGLWYHSICIKCYIVTQLFVTSEQARCIAAQIAEYRFRSPKTSEGGETCVASAIPKSTQYKNKWAAGIFEDWRRARFPKVATLEPGVVFERYELHKVQPLKVPWAQMEFIQEVAKPLKERYSTRLCVENVVSLEKRTRSWILILPMFRTRVALILLYIALFIIDSDILIVQLHLGLPLYSL